MVLMLTTKSEQLTTTMGCKVASIPLGIHVIRSLSTIGYSTESDG